eukprot:TRINITY_DN68072_c8_g5_i1.p1 TRINITY_DN68072_c8_g5~~TRINITY_DN68072_c8_g5_i1.p1  ORF type:complete len:194 (+),score=18.24 TRINITY_DN68072_c8_g5_i1:39-620(+)
MHPGAIGARAGAMRAGRSRAQKRHRELDKEIDALFQKYDLDHSHYLEREELARLLTDMNDGHPPTDGELQWVLYSADKSDGSLNGKVNRKEVKEGIKAWKSFRDNRSEIDAIFNKYDVSHSGSLNESELQAVLTDLNDGERPTTEEVQWVLRKADQADGVTNGGVDKTELTAAISLWYSHHSAHHDHHCCCLM